MIACYAITQAGCKSVMPILLAALDFTNELDYDECAPMATFESAIRVIQFEFEEKALNRVSFLSETSSAD